MENIPEENEVESVETDEEYVFEASQFYDFTRPEFDYEIEEAERWFEASGDYPPSPFIVKLNLEKILYTEILPSSCSKASHNNTKSISSSSNAISSGKKDSKGKSLSPSFMEPTASHLAKQKTNHTNSAHVCTRFQKISARLSQKGSQSPTGSDVATTKRQKLSVGYLRKAAQLKHQFLLMHKSTKRVTVPKEPELETMLRAQRRRSKNSSACSETESKKRSFGSFKAHPLNKKILEPRLSQQRKKSPPTLPEFQVFHLKTMERANHHASKLSENPPTEQFSKLSLGPASQRSSAKDKKKGDCDNSFQADFWRCNAKPNHCGDDIKFHEAKCWPDMSRSLDIR